MWKACLLALLSVTLFLLAATLENTMLVQFLEIVAAGASVLCFLLVTKETQKKK